MKKNKLKIITIIALIILIVMVSVVGIYKQNQNKMENQVKDYQYSMDLTGKRVLTLKLDTGTENVIKDKDGNKIESATDEEIQEKGYKKEEVKKNKNEDLTKDNYRNAKKIIQGRLDSLNKKIVQNHNMNSNLEFDKINVADYEVRLNEANGEVTVEIPDSDYADSIVANLSTVGKFEIVDSETKNVLLNNENISSCQVESVPTASGTVAYVAIQFNNDGKKKLEEISNTYVKVDTDTQSSSTKESDEEKATTSEENKEEAKEKTVSMQIDGQEQMSTAFSEPVTDGKIYLSIGKASTDRDTVKDNIRKAQNIASLLDNKAMPLTYEVADSNYVVATIENATNVILIGVAILTVIALVIFVVKFKAMGILALIADVGLAGLLLLIVRYWNVVISLEGIVALYAILVLNFVLSYKMLKNISKENQKEEIKVLINKPIKEISLRVIPLFILSIVLTFSQRTPANSFGKVMFWGLVLVEIYNLLITKNLLKYGKDK